MKISCQAAARTGPRDLEANTAGFAPATAEWVADDHQACYPSSCQTTTRVTGGRAAGRLPGMQLFGHTHAEIANRTGIAASAICGTMTVDAGATWTCRATPPPGQLLRRGPDGAAGLAPGYPPALARSRY